VALLNTHLTIIEYDHYDFAEMKRVSSGLCPIISIDRKDSKPLYRQVYDAYRVAIVGGNLRAGQRVPSTRLLAVELGISRIPILNAYAQLLAEGYFESRVGAGTVISRSLPEQGSFVLPANKRNINVRSGSRELSRRSAVPASFERFSWRRGWGAFGVGQVAFDEFPFGIWNSLVTRHCRNALAKSLDYGDPMGSGDLRNAITMYLRTARAVRCEAHQIMIVTGSQQALDITARVLLDPGDRVWMEEPGYRLAGNVFVLNGCTVVPVPVDYSGMNVSIGMQQCRNARAALVCPSHQYPLGMTMSVGRRLELVNWAEHSGAWIIEDDYDSEYRYESMPIPSLQGLDTNSRVIYIGTFSKVLFPSLRLGYLVIPPDLIKRFLAVRLAMDITPSSFFQAVLADFIRDGHFSRHIRRMKVLYSERRNVLTESIRKYFGYGADIIGGQAGMHLSVTLKGIDDREVAERAARRNLSLLPLSSSYLSNISRQGFILGFGSTAANDIPAAVRKLRAVIQSR
jgi:GntR family transcriptional regulator/MocR family aminotransferase